MPIFLETLRETRLGDCSVCKGTSWTLNGSFTKAGQLTYPAGDGAATAVGIGLAGSLGLGFYSAGSQTASQVMYFHEVLIPNTSLEELSNLDDKELFTALIALLEQCHVRDQVLLEAVIKDHAVNCLVCKNLFLPKGYLDKHKEMAVIYRKSKPILSNTASKNDVCSVVCQKKLREELYTSGCTV